MVATRRGERTDGTMDSSIGNQLYQGRDYVPPRPPPPPHLPTPFCAQAIKANQTLSSVRRYNGHSADPSITETLAYRLCLSIRKRDLYFIRYVLRRLEHNQIMTACTHLNQLCRRPATMVQQPNDVADLDAPDLASDWFTRKVLPGEI